MLDQLFRRPRVRDRIRANILGDWIGPYVAHLQARGHPPGVIQQYAQAVEHLGAWLASEHITVEAVTRATIDSFLHDHLPSCQCPTPAPTCLYQVRAALAHLPNVPGVRLSSAEPASARHPADVAVEHLHERRDRHRDRDDPQRGRAATQGVSGDCSWVSIEGLIRSRPLRRSSPEVLPSALRLTDPGRLARLRSAPLSRQQTAPVQPRRRLQLPGPGAGAAQGL